MEVLKVLQALDRVQERTGEMPDIEIIRKYLNDRAVVKHNPETAFQDRVMDWFAQRFGDLSLAKTEERACRFIEEALKLVQAVGLSARWCSLLVDHVFRRPAGNVPQEIGGVMTTLAVLAEAQGLNMMNCGDAELDRIYRRIDEIRRKDTTKPGYSPLPGTGATEQQS